MKLVRDTANSNMIDGVDHIKFGVLVAVIFSFTTLPFWWGGLGVFIAFLGMELYQEYEVQKEGLSSNTWKDRFQHRLQDVAFPTIAYFPVYFLITFARGFM